MECHESKSKVDLLSDRISALPDELVDCILDNLPLHDAIRTSVLSKRWRYCWTRISNLDFGIDFISRHPYDYDLVQIIDSVFLRHYGLVNKFCLCLTRKGEKYEGMDIRKWMWFLSKKGVKEIVIVSCHYIRIPSNIFDCCGLRRLHLQNCVLMYSDRCNGFKELVSLVLTEVSMSLEMRAVIFNSPMLEKFDIKYIRNEEVFSSDVVRGANLKSLAYRSYGKAELVCCEELTELTYALIFSEVKIPTWSLTSSKLNQFSCLLPRIEKLVLDSMAMNSFISGDAYISISSPFRFLEHLELRDIDTASVVTAIFVFCMLRSAPNLQSLRILGTQWAASNSTAEMKAATIQYYDLQQCEGELSSIHTFHLEAGLRGTVCVLSLTRAILSCCPKLERVTINAPEILKECFSGAVKCLPRSSIVKVHYYGSKTRC